MQLNKYHRALILPIALFLVSCSAGRNLTSHSQNREEIKALAEEVGKLEESILSIRTEIRQLGLESVRKTDLSETEDVETVTETFDTESVTNTEVDNFDDTLNVKFSTYAVPMIMGEIKRFLRDDGMIKVSRSLKETAGKARPMSKRRSYQLSGRKNGTRPKPLWKASILRWWNRRLNQLRTSGNRRRLRAFPGGRKL